MQLENFPSSSKLPNGEKKDFKVLNLLVQITCLATVAFPLYDLTNICYKFCTKVIQICGH